MNDEVLLDNLQSHWLTIVDDGARGGEGEEALKERGLANSLITHNHQFGAVEGNWGILIQVKDVLDDLGSGLFSHFQGSEVRVVASSGRSLMCESILDGGRNGEYLEGRGRK